MKNVLTEARKMAVALQGLPIARHDLNILNQAIKAGKPGVIMNAMTRCRKWVPMAEARQRTLGRAIERAREIRENAKLAPALAKQAEPLFPIKD